MDKKSDNYLKQASLLEQKSETQSQSTSKPSTQQKSFFVFAESIFKAVFSLLKYAVSIGVVISFWVMLFRSCVR